jgi:hypothetical protein
MTSAVEGEPRGSLPVEVALVWAIYLLDAVAMLVTYSRLPADKLYHVSGGGLRGGLSRVLVFSNFSMALVAIATLLLLLERLPSRSSRTVTLVAVALCLPVFWPGVVDPADLDARPINVVAGLGVLMGLAVTVVFALQTGIVRGSAGVRGDRARIGVAVVATIVALPWLAAELGLFLDGVPLLGWLYQTGRDHRSASLVAVHHGHHHGMDGLLLLLTAMLLSRLVPAVGAAWLRRLLGAYLALMTAYAVGNIANDFWTEQIWKRGWTSWQLPDVLEPKPSLGWTAIVLAAGALYAAAARRGPRQSRPSARTSALRAAASRGSRS